MLSAGVISGWWHKWINVNRLAEKEHSSCILPQITREVTHIIALSNCNLCKLPDIGKASVQLGAVVLKLEKLGLLGRCPPSFAGGHRPETRASHNFQYIHVTAVQLLFRFPVICTRCNYCVQLFTGWGAASMEEGTKSEREVTLKLCKKYRLPQLKTRRMAEYKAFRALL